MLPSYDACNRDVLITNLSGIIGLEAGKPYLRGKEMSTTKVLKNAWLRIVDAKIDAFGSMDTLPPFPPQAYILDGRGGMVMPAFCDSHTHIVYPESRAGEFLDKIRGLSYEEIAARGGGILNSADRLAEMSENMLFDVSMERVREVMSKGTGALEIKSGYGLSLNSELKMLRVIARLAEAAPIPIRATFLGAHAVGRKYAGRQEEYVDHVVRDMIPAVAAQGIAQYVDVFCDTGFFTPDQTHRILSAAARYGLRPKIHANELDVSGGVEVGVARDALSVDHLERAGEEQLRMLGESRTAATMLPGASFFLGMPYGDARRAISHNAILTLASDFNPGSSPSGDMRFVWALACIKMRLTPVEAFNALTVNGAYAMGLEDTVGSIGVGRPANFILTKPLDNITEIPYRYTKSWIDRVFLGAQTVFG